MKQLQSMAAFGQPQEDTRADSLRSVLSGICICLRFQDVSIIHWKFKQFQLLIEEANHQVVHVGESVKLISGLDEWEAVAVS
jgi:hypothetical protein